MSFNLNQLPGQCYYNEASGILVIPDRIDQTVPLKANHSRPTFGSWIVCDATHASASFVPVINASNGEKITYQKTEGTVRKIADILDDYSKVYFEKRAEIEEEAKKEFERKGKERTVCYIDLDTVIVVGGLITLIMAAGVTAVLGVSLPIIILS